MKAYIKLDGRWYHVTVIEVYFQQDIFGQTVKMVQFYKGKNSREIMHAPRSQFVMDKPKARAKKKTTGDLS